MNKFPMINPRPNYPTIEFSAPREQIDLDAELPRILHGQGWACGTYFNVQFLDIKNDKEKKLLSTALYVVTEETESLHVSDANPYQPMTRTVYTRKAEIVGEWQYFEDIGGATISKIAEGTKIVWNPGKKVHELKLGGKVIYSNKDKEQVKRVANA